MAHRVFLYFSPLCTISKDGEASHKVILISHKKIIYFHLDYFLFIFLLHDKLIMNYSN